MFPAQSNQAGALNLSHLNNTALNLVEAICSVIAMPVEFIIRPWFGTQFYELPVFFFCGLLMIFIPLLSALFSGLLGMIPFSHAIPSPGMLDMASLSKTFFLLLIFHAGRLYRRILNPNLETHSRYEGPALPVFAFIPGSSSLWRVRIVFEPVAIFLIATILQDLFIFQSSLATYVHCAALALAMKSSIAFFRSWKVGRDIMDAARAAPVLAKLVDNQATQDELYPLHLTNFPENTPPETRRIAAVYIARAYNPNA